jgi:hypothetical protein
MESLEMRESWRFRGVGVCAVLFLAACGSTGSRVGDAGTNACQAECTENSECNFGERCRDNCCETGCDTNDDCAGGQTCQNERCAAPGTRDGGTIFGRDGGGGGGTDGGGGGGTDGGGGGSRDGGLVARDGGGSTVDGGSSSVVPVGAACAGDGDCNGGLCATDLPGGYCTQTACDTTPCPSGSVCFNIGGGESACFKSCTSPSECRVSEGYTCDADDTCYPDTTTPSDGGTTTTDGGGATGTGAVGAACTAGNQCAGGGCLQLPGGYCTMMGCSSSRPCPTGSTCFGIGNSQTACFKNCTSPSECRESEGYTCDSDNTCYTGPSGGGPCSSTNPTGTCPSGQVCSNGMCQTFTCSDTRFEPNESQSAAATLPTSTTNGLALCAGDKDWYRFNVTPRKVKMVSITHSLSAGDLDLTAYTGTSQCLGNRMQQYCGANYARDYETGEEWLSFLNGGSSGDRSFAVQVGGRTSTVANLYSLGTVETAWQDGRDCTEVDSAFPCNGGSTSNVKLIEFPYADPNDGYVGDGYRFDSMANYRFLRRETIQLIRYAIKETQTKFPNTKPLGLIDMCQRNGITPGYDVNDPRHPESTHDQGGNIDIAYYTTLASNGTLEYNEARIICGPTERSNTDGYYCTSGATTQHVVDLPRQVYFMAKLFESSRVRVIGVDQIIAPLLQAEATRQKDMGWISSTLAGRFTSKMAFGEGWPFHHHHIHLSLNWWSQGKPGERAPADGCGFDLRRFKRPRPEKWGAAISTP